MYKITYKFVDFSDKNNILHGGGTLFSDVEHDFISLNKNLFSDKDCCRVDYFKIHKETKKEENQCNYPAFCLNHSSRNCLRCKRRSRENIKDYIEIDKKLYYGKIGD